VTLPDARGPARVPDGLASVSREERDAVVIVTVQGEIDVSNVAEIGSQLTEISNEPLGLVVDLGGVTHLDSAGIAMLYDLNARLDRRRLRLVVVTPPTAPARRVLELTAFSRRARLADDVDAAVTVAAGLSDADADA
jgi:anti-sigma B factor antagonist